MGIAVAACIDVRPFQQSDAGDTCTPDFSVNGSATTTWTADGPGGTVTGPSFLVHFANNPSKFHFPDLVQIGGTDKKVVISDPVSADELNSGGALIGGLVMPTDASKAEQKDAIAVLEQGFLVAPPDHEGKTLPDHAAAFGNVPRDPLPFPSMLIASTDDPYCSIERAADLATCWASDFHLAGPAGHIDSASGHGPWPEGLVMFTRLMQRLR